MPCGGGPIIGIIGGPPIGGVGSMPGRGGPAAFETEKCQCTINVKTLYKCTEIYMSNPIEWITVYAKSLIYSDIWPTRENKYPTTDKAYAHYSSKGSFYWSQFYHHYLWPWFFFFSSLINKSANLWLSVLLFPLIHFHAWAQRWEILKSFPVAPQQATVHLDAFSLLEIIK